jgi:hypothetical protein
MKAWQDIYQKNKYSTPQVVPYYIDVLVVDKYVLAYFFFYYCPKDQNHVFTGICKEIYC